MRLFEKRIRLAAVGAAIVVVLAAGFFMALAVRSVVAGPDSGPAATPPNPGHSWSEIGDLPGTMWHSNNDGPGSGLDADLLDGLQSTEIQDADDYVSNAGYCAAAGDADTLDGEHASAFADASHIHDDRYYTETELQTSGSASVHWGNLSSVPAGFADDTDDDILGALSCSSGQIAKWDGSAWHCGADVDTDTQLSEGQVETYVTNGPLDLDAATTLGGASISTGPHTTSLPWSSITTKPAGFADDTDDDILGGLSCAGGQIAKWDGSGWQCAADDTGAGSFWSLTGNSGTTPGTNFLGTTDSQALELWVNSARALRLEPGVPVAGSAIPNVIGGYSGNWVYPYVRGATIAGGGDSYEAPYGFNRVTDDHGTVGGGSGNQAGNGTHPYDEAWATVGGGRYNTASGEWSTVGGGNGNTAAGKVATVGGGQGNWASGVTATVPGGDQNTAAGHYSFAAGRRAKANHQGAFVWADSTDADFASTTADQFLVRASGGVGLNVGSGVLRLEPATDWGGRFSPNLVGGYSGNSVTAGVAGATIGGGGLIADVNRVTDEFGTVGGGANNQAGDNAGTTSDRRHATVGGGYYNTASGDTAVVGGGEGNTASGTWATIAGGSWNSASGVYSTVGGGYANAATGNFSMVLGGSHNTAAGINSFAAGANAKANNLGCFVWSDTSGDDLACNDNNRFIARASGGVYLYTSADLSAGAYLAAGSGSWSSVSDRDLKDNFTPVDGQEVLASLAEIPITTWNYKAQEESILHMGPVAQDFYAAFGLGESDTAISSVDADGVALAAIQGLYELSQEQDARIQALEARVATLEGEAGTNGASRRPLSSAMPAGWLLLGGLFLGGLVLVQRRRAGDRR